MKIAVIGCTHAGTAAVINAAKLYPGSEISVYERNDNISFLSCGIALNVQGIVHDPESLFYSSPKELASLGVKTYMKHDVLDVDIESKKLKVKNMETEQLFDASYDKLIVTCGSWPIIPDLEGIGSDRIFLCKNYQHAKTLISESKKADTVAIIGAGYIGVELVEAFIEQGKKVILMDMQDRIMSQYLDGEFTAQAQQSMSEHGVVLALGECVKKFEESHGRIKVITDRHPYDADMAVLCIGFRPNTGLFKGKLEMMDNGAVIVDKYMNTSAKDVMAAGDSAAIIYNPTGGRAYIPLATNAVRMGTLAAYNLVAPRYEYIGTQSSSGIKIFKNNFAATGLTEEMAAKNKIKYKAVTVSGTDRPAFMPTYGSISFKVVYEEATKIVLGAQIVSHTDCTEIINAMSIVIQNKMTMPQLAMVDQFFQPHFNNPWNIINSAGLATL